jgi:hypothetical protein
MADGFQPKFADLVRNFTTTTGLDDFVLGPAVNGFASFADACAIGDSFYYSALGVDNPADTEVGRGTLLQGGVISRDPVTGKKTNFKSGTKAIALVAAAEWFSQADAARAGAGPTNVKSFGAAGDGVSDDTAAIQAALDHVETVGGGALYFPEGVYVVSSYLTVHPRTYIRGAGRRTTTITSAHAGGGGADAGENVRNGAGLVTLAPINASSPIHVVIEDIGIQNTNPANVGAAYYDRGGTYISCRNCLFGGFKYGVVLDQSELVDIDLCEIGSQSDGGAGVWIVNGSDLTPGTNSGFSNRISVKRCQINQYQTVYGIRDDGGAAHVFEDNNYNGCLNHIYATAVIPLDIRGGEFESAGSHCIQLESITPDGVILGGPYTSIRGGSFAATIGHAAVYSSTSGGLLQIDGTALFAGGAGTYAITGANKFAAIWLFSYSNLTACPTIADGEAQFVNVDLTAVPASINGLKIAGDGTLTAPNIGSAAGHDETDFLHAANNLGEIADRIETARNLGTGIMLGHSAVPSSHSGDTAEFPLASVTVPAGVMGKNGRIEIKADFSFNSSADLKIMTVKFGASAVASISQSTQAPDMIEAVVANRNNASAQRQTWRRFNGTGSNVPTSGGASAVDTSASVDIAIIGQLTSPADIVTLEGYQVILYPKD